MKYQIILCLWFDGKAEEAAPFYVSVFSNSNKSRTGNGCIYANEKIRYREALKRLIGMEFIYK
ncbi:VOC family protein [uncultured Dysgonomonas sp.]|uniref:VOC family protein n=1 Tax=uncultured Dysgonomonas sp. TaxID=206096 RepID=UPI0025E935AA|nr:VOC family protein [uncultured Dysgonomonas sp.]